MSNRISNLRNLMVKHHLDALLISSLPNITYLTNFSHFSKDEREAFLFITTDKQYILTDGRYSETVKNRVKDFKLIKISPKLSFEKALKILAKKYKIKKVGIEQQNITVAEHKKLSSCFNDLNHFSMTNLRAIKNAKEVSAIEKACKLGDKTFEYILNKVKLGVTEKQLSFEIEFFIKKHGADISFPPIVAFGKNSAIPHHVPTHNSKLLTHNSIILLDFGVRLNNYCSDMTRTVFFGQPTNEQKKMYQTVLEAQEKAIESLSHLGRWRGNDLDSSEVNYRGIKASAVDKIARKYITSHGYPTIPHSLGHGIGLEVHESPRLSPKSKDILKPNMVFTIEPGIYILGFGGVRIEDVVVLEKEGPRLLTRSNKGKYSVVTSRLSS